MRNLPALALLLALTAAPAWAQAPARIRGTLSAVDGHTAIIHTRNGQDVTVALAPETGVVSVSVSQFADVHPGSFIGAAAIPQSDGTLKALEVHIFPESMRGTGEGHRPWDLGPDSTMTNGTVGQIAGADGRSFTVKYKDGEKTVVVPPDVPVVVFTPSTVAALAPGEHVVVTAAKSADGAMTATRVNFGAGGIDLPL